MDTQDLLVAERQTLIKTIAPGLGYLRIVMVNVYFVWDPFIKDKWLLIDCGMGECKNKIKKAAEEMFGDGARPEAIVLTHGHFDHVGALPQLAEEWRVPVYAHRLELPYLTGKSSYPPPDPTVGKGIMPYFSPLFKRTPIDLGNNVRILEQSDPLPAFPEWKVVFTPGHSPGHISFFRESDRSLIVGDAFVTVKQESALAILTQKQKVNGPPAYFTIDWLAAEKSVIKLSKLKPRLAATGHGIPMSGEELESQLNDLANNFDKKAVPYHGRYVQEPVVANEEGVVTIPTEYQNPYPKIVLSTVLIGIAGITLFKVLEAVNKK